MSQNQLVEVYRIEKNGQGPFHAHTECFVDNEVFVEWLKAKRSVLNYSMPTPTEDDELLASIRSYANKSLLNDDAHEDDTDIDKWFFGAPNLNALRSWIIDPTALAAYGFKIAKYIITQEKLVTSSVQVMFMKAAAKKVEEICPTEI